ncbi:MAG: hypothetical protein RLZZ595_1687 [Bacteroidota bacterium]|jgi:hypothetical protein
MEQIRNKVAESGILTLDLENYYPAEEVVEFDLKPFLFMEMILKEKEFREKIENHDWTQYQNKTVAVFCSADAILPMWAFMLVASKLADQTTAVFLGNKESCIQDLCVRNIKRIDTSAFLDKRVVVKGCGDKPIPEAAYLEIANRLTPVVKSLMYGEPCSTVPVFKRK